MKYSLYYMQSTEWYCLYDNTRKIRTSGNILEATFRIKPKFVYGEEDMNGWELICEVHENITSYKDIRENHPELFI